MLRFHANLYLPPPMGAGFGVAPTSPKARPQHGPGMAEASHGPAGPILRRHGMCATRADVALDDQGVYKGL